MRVYQPSIRLTLVKTRARDVVSGNLPANAERYKIPRIFDLTPYLSDGGVRIQKSVREPAGAFSISLTTRPYGDMLETLDMLIEPMDMIEIRMAHEPPGDDTTPEARNNWPPVVMRGFVSQIAKSESIANGAPQRSIVVSGQDYGKIWQVAQVYYLNNSGVGDNIVHSLKFFQKYASETDARLMQAKKFIKLFIREILEPYIKTITTLADRRGGMPKEIDSLISIEGIVTPFGVGNAQDMNFYQFMTKFLDVGAFNELYIEDVGASVVLVARPQPALAGDGEPCDKSTPAPETLSIGLGDVTSSQLSRSDSGVYNIFEVESSRATVIDQTLYRTLAMESATGNPLQLKELNQEADFFGERRINASITLNNPALVVGDSERKAIRPGETTKTVDWMAACRQRLIDLNKDASVFERGSLRLKGNEKLRAGMRLRVVHSSSLTVTYYVPSISHEYIPGGGFFTTAQVERGNGFILSAGIDRAPDLARRDFGGVK
jgi:hypothetical protein